MRTNWFSDGRTAGTRALLSGTIAVSREEAFHALGTLRDGDRARSCGRRWRQLLQRLERDRCRRRLERLVDRHRAGGRDELRVGSAGGRDELGRGGAGRSDELRSRGAGRSDELRRGGARRSDELRSCGARRRGGVERLVGTGRRQRPELPDLCQSVLRERRSELQQHAFVQTMAHVCADLRPAGSHVGVLHRVRQPVSECGRGVRADLRVRMHELLERVRRHRSLQPLTPRSREE